MSIVVKGIQSTQHAMLVMNARVETLRVKAMDDFGTKVSHVSKQRCPVDTGALRDSIKNRLNKLTPTLVQEKVSAGDPEVRRGMGKHRISTKTGSPVSVQATNEYAVRVNDKEKFMETGRDWASSNAIRELRRSLRKIMRLI